MKNTKNIVCLGGGTGQASVMKGLCQIPNLNITGIVTVTDNGGSSGSIRKILGIPQPGDSRNCLTAVSDPDDIITKLLAFRFSEGELAGTNLGNLIIAALTRILGDFGEAVSATNTILKTKAKVLPVTTKSTHICVQLKNGKDICGEWEIIARSDKNDIAKVFLQEKADAYPPCIEAINSADLIIIGPGSLYTALISNLLVGGIADAIRESKAKKVYIVNLMTQPGQTIGYKLSDHIKVIEKYLGSKLDYILANNKRITKAILENYKKFHSQPVKIDDIPDSKRLIKAPLAHGKLDEAIRTDPRQGQAFKEWGLWTHILRHNPNQVAKEVEKLL
jgi:uncharacterized cofD-like protein